MMAISHGMGYVGCDVWSDLLLFSVVEIQQSQQLEEPYSHNSHIMYILDI
jgi:hypothetical protein